MKKIIFVMLMVAMIIVPAVVSASAVDTDSCIIDTNNGVIYDTECDTKDGCGFLWLKDTFIEHLYYRCQNNSIEHSIHCSGTLYRSRKNGCCEG